MSNNEILNLQSATQMETDARQWHTRMEGLQQRGARIVALRGAGTVNGIDPRAAEFSVDYLVGYVDELTQDGTEVALIFDGDTDNPEKPDIGFVFGRLADHFKDNVSVSTIAAQSQGWYSPNTEGGPLESSNGTPYETYVFPDSMPGAHAALTQSEDLVGYGGYEQIFVGPAGAIASKQLQDLSAKTVSRDPKNGSVPVTVLGTPNNAAIGQELSLQLVQADQTVREKIEMKLQQRDNQPFGALFSPEGEFIPTVEAYPGVALYPIKFGM